MLEGLQKDLRKAFPLSVMITSTRGDDVWFDLGKEDGLWMDTGFYAYQYTTTGEKRKIGYVKVRRISDSPADKEGGMSRGQIITGRIEGGEKLIEYPLVDLAFHVYLTLKTHSVDENENRFKESVGERHYASKGSDLDRIHSEILDERGGLFGGLRMALDYNLARHTGLSELYLFCGLNLDDLPGLFMIGFDVGLMKKIYFRRIALIFGSDLNFAGSSIDIYSDEEESAGQEDPSDMSVGIEFFSGLELFLHPQFSIRALFGYNLAGRLFIVDAGGVVIHFGGFYTW
jgi:hypothetical protein